MSKCPKCGTEVESGMKFCGECGSPIPQTKKCPKCGSELPLATKFCQECGYNFSAAPAASGAAGAPLMGDKNVIAGDVNNSVSMSNSNNTTNVTTNVTTNDTTNNTTNNVSNVSNVTNNSQVTNNSTTNNTYIKQVIRQETELDKEAKRVQIEKLRLEKEQQEAELAQEKIKLQEIEEEANKSPYSKNTFRKLGLWAGFLGLHYAYVKRWPLFAVTIALMIGMAMFGKQADPNAAGAADAAQIEQATKTDDPSGKPEKTDPITLILGVGLMVLWFGGAFFITTDAKGRKLK